MGLFDSLKKLSENIGKEFESGAGKEVLDNLKSAIETAGREVSSSVN